MLSEEELKGVPVLVFANKQVRSFPSTLLGLDVSPSIRGGNATLLRFLAAYPSFLSGADFPPFPSSLVRSFVLFAQDVPGALPSGEISDRLGLAGKEKSREWSVRGSCALKGEGLEEVSSTFPFCRRSVCLGGRWKLET